MEWLDVDEYPLPRNQDVLLLWGGEVVMGWNEALVDEPPDYVAYSKFGPMQIRHVTHWAPLPTIPEEIANEIKKYQQ